MTGLEPAVSDTQPAQQPAGGNGCWDLAGRDVVPDLTPYGAARDVGAAILYAMLASDGAPWSPPYEEIRARMPIRRKVIEPEREEQADSRLRTYFTFFRGLGLLFEEGGALHVTPAGKRLAEIMTAMYGAVDDAARDAARSTRWKVARVALTCLSRYQLRNPTTASRYPVGADVFPLWAIWKAMRDLEDRIHWEEVGRVLTKCLQMSDLPAAIEKIREARLHDDYDADDAEVMERLLGPRCPDLGDDQQDRIIVWLSRAAFKDVLLEHRNRDDGYQYLQSEFLPLVDEALADAPTYREFGSAEEYYAWLGSPPQGAVWGDASGRAEEDQTVHEVVERARLFGDRAIIAIVGVAGTGKTRAAYLAAHALSGGDDSRVEFVQFHAAFTYEEFVGGLAPKPDGQGFEPKEGVLLLVNDKARTDPENRYVLVIDELSRADVANVLGELLTYVEYRERPFVVSGLGEEQRLAPNLTILVTMNPNDRSVINLDDAVVRRLRQVETRPSTSALRQILADAGMIPHLIEEVAEWFAGLPNDVPFGHGVFVNVSSHQELYRLWHEQLRFFLRRGGITTYPNPAAIEAGYKWRDPKYLEPQINGGATEPSTPTEALTDADLVSGENMRPTPEAEGLPNA